jgi:hypothetical protein
MVDSPGLTGFEHPDALIKCYWEVGRMDEVLQRGLQKGIAATANEFAIAIARQKISAVWIDLRDSDRGAVEEVFEILTHGDARLVEGGSMSLRR